MASEHFDLIQRIYGEFNSAPFTGATRDGVAYCSALVDVSHEGTAPEAWLFSLALRRLVDVFGRNYKLACELSESAVNEVPFKGSRRVPWLAACLEVLPEQRGYLEALADVHRCGVPHVHMLALRHALVWVGYDFINEESRAALRAYLRAAGFGGKLLDALHSESLERARRLGVK